MPYVWFITCTYMDGSDISYRYPDEDGGKMAFDNFLSRVADEKRQRELSEYAAMPQRNHIASISQPQRVYVSDPLTDPVVAPPSRKLII